MEVVANGCLQQYWRGRGGYDFRHLQRLHGLRTVSKKAAVRAARARRTFAMGGSRRDQNSRRPGPELSFLDVTGSDSVAAGEGSSWGGILHRDRGSHCFGNGASVFF